MTTSEAGIIAELLNCSFFGKHYTCSVTATDISFSSEPTTEVVTADFPTAVSPTTTIAVELSFSAESSTEVVTTALSIALFDNIVSVRLAGNNQSSNAGRLEVNFNGTWGTVCNAGFDDNDAQVACFMLGFGSGVYIGSAFGAGTGQILIQHIQCNGLEQSLAECSHDGWGVHYCSHFSDVSIYCENGTANISDEVSVRLAGYDQSSNAGRLQISYNGIWGTLCDYQIDNNVALVACSMLGFRSGVPIGHAFGNGTGPIWLSHVHCSGEEMSLSDCYHSGWGVVHCAHDNDVSIYCHNDERNYSAEVSVRLAGNDSFSTEGRLEVSYNGIWGTVCGYADDNVAQVACFMLGFRSGVSIGYTYGAGTGPIWLDIFYCSGHEESLADCSHSGWGIRHCNHHDDVSISCNNDEWITEDVTTGIPTAVAPTTTITAQSSFTPESGTEVVTTEFPTTLVTDIVLVRLAGNKQSSNAGRLEVNYNGTWGTVCNAGFDDNDAQVACFMLGFGSGVYIGSAFGAGTGQIWIQHLQCNGLEQSLAECSHDGWGVHYCSHFSDVSIYCDNGTANISDEGLAKIPYTCSCSLNVDTYCQNRSRVAYERTDFVNDTRRVMDGNFSVNHSTTLQSELTNST